MLSQPEVSDLFFTEEEPMEDGFVFTEEIYIIDEGLKALKENG
jgi:hypothetical protein